MWTLRRPPLLLLLLLLAGLQNLHALTRTQEYQRYDGWFNNLANPDWGSVGSRLHRDSPSNYADGVYRLNEALPSARAISDLAFRGPSGIPNKRNITTMFAFFSQVVAYELMQGTAISCPLELLKIPVPKCDPVFDSKCLGDTHIPFIRAKYDKATGHGLNSPREQVNERTAWIDASFLYSTQEPWVAALRSWRGGRLAEGNLPGYPPLNNPHVPLSNPPPPQIHRLMNPERLFVLGDSRIHENPGLLAFGLILYRWHNMQADRLRSLHPDWTDEELFQAARRWLIATLQKIIFYDFLPILLGVKDDSLPPYNGYKPHLPPAISHAFATAAFRFPHSIVPPALFLRKRSDSCEWRHEVAGYGALRLCQNWWNAQDIVQEYSVDEIVLGMASQIAEAEDNVVVEDLRDYIFGPMHFTRLDVVSSSIMRGRDNGVPPYNTLRRTFDLPANNWTTINPELYAANQTLFDELSALYKHDISQLDAYVGGMLESNGVGPGELFAAIIKDQFWFENSHNGIFSEADVQAIRRITLRDIIRETTNISDSQLQMDVFAHGPQDPCPQPYQLNATGLEPCVPFMRFDHFTGNEVTYIFTLIGLACLPLVCVGIGYVLVQRRRKMGWHWTYDSVRASDVHDEKSPDSIYRCTAIQWLSEEHCRAVSVRVLARPPSLVVRKPRGAVLRSMPLKQAVKATVSSAGQTSTAMASHHGPFCVISTDKHHDLVLRLSNETQCSQLLQTMHTILEKEGGRLDVSHASNEQLLASAETKEQRQQRLDHFFRQAYAMAFDESKLDDGSCPAGSSSSNGSTSAEKGCANEQEDVMRMELSRSELAEALGMRDESLFVRRLFVVCAQPGATHLNFQQFFHFIRMFANGSQRERFKLLYELCAAGREDGRVPRDEFFDFVKSLNLVAGVQIDEQDQHQVIDNLLHRSGVSDSAEWLSLEDFEAIFSQMDDLRRPVGVDMKGAKLKVNLEETSSLNSFAVLPAEDDWSSCWWWRRRPLAPIVTLLSFLDTYRQHIFYLVVFFSANIMIFLERFSHFRYELEHRDLQRVMGVGVAITRGAASTISFCMALVLLTVCRNVITLLRDTAIGEYVPFDSAITFHKIVAVTCAFWAILHSVGHCSNFYHVATQSQEGLHCLFQEAVFGSNFLPSISYWFYGTVTGITGILLVAVMSIIYVFALPVFMRRAYHAFRLTHLLNIAFYALTFLHGLPRLLDSPKFWYYVIGPIIVFVIDRVMGARQQYKQLHIINATLLPSDIIYLQFKRPASFRFRSGQWVRVSSPDFSCSFNESHAFSLASAPQAPTLELYIKAVGPWTWKLRAEVMNSQASGSTYPMLHLKGPYGDGNQEWRQFEVCVFVAGGIGITPYASTLTDLVMETSSGRHTDIRCKKVYFVWICPSQKSFEWFIDVLRDVEELDRSRTLETHIFVTQFFHKFDLRTTMLYICEKHFRGDSGGRSMFTGLRAQSHFGRPNLPLFFNFIQSRHRQHTSEIGVFSCGPAAVNKEIGRACAAANRARDAPSFQHRFETF